MANLVTKFYIKMTTYFECEGLNVSTCKIRSAAGTAFSRSPTTLPGYYLLVQKLV